MTFLPTEPFNDLPDLPPPQELETLRVLKAAIDANARLAELKGSGRVIPNQNILLNALTIQESRLSSEIEGIVTTTDQLYRAMVVESERTDLHTKEVLRYRDAIWHGVARIREGRPLATVLFEELVQIIKQNTAGVRRGLGTALLDERTLSIVYTPPVGEDLIRRKLGNLEQFLHGNRETDALVRMAVGHYQFEAIHPFSDGNGRTGRLLNVLFLMNQELLLEPVLYLSRYLIRHKNEYYRLLREVTEKGNWEAWVLFMLEAVRSTAESTLNQILSIRDLLEQFGDQVRQRAKGIYSKELVELLFDRPYCKVQFLVDSGIAKRQTAAKYLKTLVDEGFLKDIKIGREKIYVNSKFMELLSTPFVDGIDTTS